MNISKRIKSQKRDISTMKLTKSYIRKGKSFTTDKLYDVHDNGCRPFRVVFADNSLYIYKQSYEVSGSDDDYDGIYEDVYDIFLKKITNFLGFWTLTKMLRIL